MNHFWEPSTGEPPIIPSKHVRLSIRTCPELLGSLASSSLAIVGLVRAACLATPGDISILECLIFHSGPFFTLRNHLYITYEYQDSTEQLRHPKHPPPKRQLYDACMERAWVDGPIGGACDRLLLVGLGLGIGDWVRVCSTCCPQRGHDYHHPAAALNKSLTLFSYVAPSFFSMISLGGREVKQDSDLSVIYLWWFLCKKYFDLLVESSLQEISLFHGFRCFDLWNRSFSQLFHVQSLGHSFKSVYFTMVSVASFVPSIRDTRVIQPRQAHSGRSQMAPRPRPNKHFITKWACKLSTNDWFTSEMPFSAMRSAKISVSSRYWLVMPCIDKSEFCHSTFAHCASEIFST